MSIWSEVRRQARARHSELANSTDDFASAVDLLAAAESKTGIRIEKRPAADALLDGADALYSRERQRIYYSAATDPILAAFHVAHEYAHHWLDEVSSICRGSDLDLTTPSEPEMSLVGEVDAYSPKERLEAQANLFAREFLLPRDKLRRHCVHRVFDAEYIASKVGVPVNLVMQQLADALLLPEEGSTPKENQSQKHPDSSQTKAIDSPLGPQRVCAGPGTGKSSTLIGRVKKLISEGEDPKSILVLTFSNFSAQDLANRLRLTIGGLATGVWAGTFHAFGLEVLRKYSREAGFLEEPELLDRTGSLMLLEEILPDLGLHHYLDLVDPMRGLRSVLAQIARAKDELAGPARYEQLARAMICSSGETQKEEGDKALEVAHAYEVYERTLRDRGCVDFGDLIARPVELLRAHPEIRDAIRLEKRHVLVDEYQDMNRASGILLSELVDIKYSPWVVGDVKQSIYRFRGASPSNMARFGADFPGANTTYLGVNYRSGGRIVRTFEAFASGMATGGLELPQKLQAHRGETCGEVNFNVASTFEAECEGISKAIRSAVAHGGHFSEHAILARSHGTLAKLAQRLERSGVPCLYFGNYFERSEIRDLLSVLSVTSERSGIGLFRMAQLPQYNIPLQDVLTVFRWRSEQGIAMLGALRRLDDIANLSEAGRITLRRLADDLREVNFIMPPHQFLLRFLFYRGDHLQPLLADASVVGQQRRLAIYQFLQFAFSFRSTPKKDRKRAFLEHVRRLEILDEEKQLRQLPAAASDIDAVRMMTVHASKGLQFRHVHIPSITSRHFPVNRTDPNPPPTGLITMDALMTREAEEESLFFVAMSRAEDGLHLSRAVSYGGGAWASVKPSPFLERIKRHLPKHPDATPEWTNPGALEAEEARLRPPEKRESWPARAIETYIDCPRRFYYEEVLQLGGPEVFSPYLQFQSALHSTVAWLRATSLQKERQEGVSARLAADWERIGPRGHAFESIYRAAAEHMLSTALKLMEGSSLPVDLSLKTGNVVITSRADRITSTPEGILIQRFKASRLAKREESKIRYTVMQQAVRTQYPGTNIHFEHVSLLTGERQRVQIGQKQLSSELGKLQETFENIAAGRFDPVPSEFKCPRCPFFFICPCH